MIIDNLSSLENIKHPVIIIGSGPAGITTALKLEQNKINSLIIEAGGIQPDENTSEYLRGEVVGDNYPDLSTIRLRQFGGTSGIWGGNCNSFRKDDFDEWPIKLKDLNVFEKEAKEILNLKDEFYNIDFSENFKLYNLNWSNVRFGDKYLHHIQNSKYINMSLNTNFINFNFKEKKVDTINCLKNNNSYNLNAKCYVLCCGGIENSRLMLWSTKKNSLSHNLNLPIGNYYMNHPYYNIGEGLVVYDKYKNFFLTNNIKKSHFVTCKSSIYLSGKKDFLIKNKILNSGLYISFDTKNRNNLIDQIRCVAPNYFKKIYEDIKAKKIYDISIDVLQEQKPEKTNSITLGKNKDPSEIPLSKIYWKRSNTEKQSVKLLAEKLGELFLENAIGRIGLKNYIFDKNIDFEFTTGNHQLGGTRMGNSENDSVVDKNLKVHNIQNLYINGSSVFRSAGHCHPTFTIVKLSLKLGNYLKNIVQYL